MKHSKENENKTIYHHLQQPLFYIYMLGSQGWGVLHQSFAKGFSMRYKMDPIGSKVL